MCECEKTFPILSACHFNKIYNNMYICLLLILDELCEAGQNLATLAMEKQILADRYSAQCTGTVQYIVQNNQTLINNI